MFSAKILEKVIQSTGVSNAGNKKIGPNFEMFSIIPIVDNAPIWVENIVAIRMGVENSFTPDAYSLKEIRFL